MSPVVMLQKVTTVWRRSPTTRRILCLALWMLIPLTAAAAAAAVWMADEPTETTKAACLRYQDRETLDLNKKYVHPALEKGCAVCHIDCSQISPTADLESMPEYFLKMEEPELCLQCHRELHPNLEAAHDGEPLGNSKCTGCHDAHASNVDKRLPEFSHGPYDARLCSACHADPVDGEVRLVADTVNDLCYGCHAEVKMQIEGAKSSHKLLEDNDHSCMECHDPHATNQESMLKMPVYELCVSCHGEKPEKPPVSEPAAEPESPPARRSGMPSLAEVMGSEQSQELNPEDDGYIDLSLPYVHEPARTSCTLCHDPHASEFTEDLNAPVYDLCMECHGKNAKIILNSDKPFPFLNGLKSLPPKSYKELPSIDLDTQYVHEPVRTSCVFCHEAHSSKYPKELYATVNEVCLACHNDANAERIMRSNRPYPLFEGKVQLPPKVFEKLSELHLIKDESVGHPLQNHPVYIPKTDTKPEFDCLTCHTAHASTTGLKRWKDKDRSSLCLECHKL